MTRSIYHPVLLFLVTLDAYLPLFDMEFLYVIHVHFGACIVRASYYVLYSPYPEY